MLLNHYWNNTDLGCFQSHILIQDNLSKSKTGTKEVVPSADVCIGQILKISNERNENSLTSDLVNLR